MKFIIGPALKVIGLALFIIIISQINFEIVFNVLNKINSKYIIFYFILFFISLIIKVFRTYKCINLHNKDIKFIDIYGCVVDSVFYGFVTPGRLGEFSKAFKISTHGVSSFDAWEITLLERVVDLGLLFGVGATGILYFTLPSYVNFWAALEFSLVYLTLFFLVLFYYSKIFYFANKKFGSNELKIKFKAVESKKSKIIRLRYLIIIIPSSLLCLLLSFAQLWLISKSIDINIPIVFLGVSFSASTLASFLPVSIAGLGTREASYIYFFKKIGIDTDSAFIISMLDGLIFPIIFISLMILSRILFFRNK